MTILQVFSPFFILRDYFLYFVHLESVFGNCVAVNDFCLKIGKYRLWSFLARFWLSPDGAQFFFTRIFTCYFISCLVNGGSPLDCAEIFFIPKEYISISVFSRFVNLKSIFLSFTQNGNFNDEIKKKNPSLILSKHNSSNFWLLDQKIPQPVSNILMLPIPDDASTLLCSTEIKKKGTYILCSSRSSRTSNPAGQR